MGMRMVVRNGEVTWREESTRERAPRRRRSPAQRSTSRTLRQYSHLNPPTITKEEAACCMSQVDALGRPPIGFCGPGCERRADRDARLGVR